MDGKTEGKTKSDRVVSPDPSNEKDSSVITVNRNETEGVPAEIVAWDHDEEHSGSMTAADGAPVEEEAAPSEPRESVGKDFLVVDDITTSQDSAVESVGKDFLGVDDITTSQDSAVESVGKDFLVVDDITTSQDSAVESVGKDFLGVDDITTSQDSAVESVGKDFLGVDDITTSQDSAVESVGKDFLGVDDITTSQDSAVEINEVNEQQMAHEKMVEISSNDEHGLPKQDFETLERQKSSPTLEEHKEDANCEYIKLFHKLCEDRDQASQRCSLLHMKLAEFFHRKAQDDTQLHGEAAASEQLEQEYDDYMNVLTDLKQKLSTESETAQQQAEELSSKAQEELHRVENEWQAFVALKQDVAVSVLSRYLGKQAAQTKVEATLTTEELLQQELIKLRCKHLKLKIKTHRLEAELRQGDTHAKDTLSLQFEQLHAERLELKKQTEKQNEESLKMQKKISSSLELLSNVKEKLFWSQMEVKAKAEQLDMTEALVAKKRDLLTRTRQARNSLQRDNVRLKEHRGLLGNRILLQDFESTVDASNLLEEQLEELKCRQGQIVFSCGR
ncbi:coiled-coil domain-containing protein 96 [Centropristis striata]|uniref:coiled-coil domain-containing protein 96 n=1 Tax=Centropristis striata TaxID=184440 RepID=UPI0027E08F1C|nr:coiled-coil domain-containing protein 96 [Centropristis striata]